MDFFLWLLLMLSSTFEDLELSSRLTLDKWLLFYDYYLAYVKSNIYFIADKDNFYQRAASA